MIETIFITLAALSLIATIFFLTQYGIRIHRINLKEEQEQRIKDHQNKLANGYKWYEWKGYKTWIYYQPYSNYTIELYRKNLNHEGAGYFKSEKDLENWLSASSITLTWSREL